MLVVDTRFFPGRRIRVLVRVCFGSSGRDFGLTVYIASSGNTVATSILSVVVVASVNGVVGGGRVVGFPCKRRMGVGWYF